MERLLLQLNREYLNYKIGIITRKPEEIYAAAYEIDYTTRIYVYLCDLVDNMTLDMLKELISVDDLLSTLYQQWLTKTDSSENELDENIRRSLMKISIIQQGEENMKKKISLKGLTHEDWLKYRKQGITGTDAGAIVGLNPYVSSFDIYQNKISDDIVEIEDNEAMRLGRDMEEYVAQRFVEATGKKVRRANAMFQNDKYEFMLADFDRLIVGEKAGLECKTVSPYSADKWKDGNVPFHYQMQVQHYLAVSGYDCWYVAALIFGREFIIRKIERDQELINNLSTIEKRFWEDNVCARVMPDPDGSDSFTNAIANLYKKSREDKEIQLFGYGDQLQRREEINELIDKLEKEKNQIDQQIKLQMQDASYAQVENFRVSWVSSNSQRIDTKRLKEEKPEIYEAYSKSSSSRRFMVKVA